MHAYYGESPLDISLYPTFYFHKILQLFEWMATCLFNDNQSTMAENSGVNLLMWGSSGAGKSYFSKFIGHLTNGKAFNPELPS